MELAKGCAPSSASTISTQLSGASLLCLLKTPKAMILVKPATVIHWHRQGFRLYWRWRSRSGRPLEFSKFDSQRRDLGPGDRR